MLKYIGIPFTGNHTLAQTSQKIQKLDISSWSTRKQGPKLLLIGSSAVQGWKAVAKAYHNSILFEARKIPFNQDHTISGLLIWIHCKSITW